MATRKRPAGGVGSNQYQTVGTPTASAPAGRVAAFSAPTASDVRNVELVRQSDGTYRDRAGRYELARYMRRSDRSRKLVQDGWDLTDREHGRTTWVAGLDTARAHVEQLRDQEDALVAALASTERKGAVRYLPSADGTDVVVELAGACIRSAGSLPRTGTSGSPACSTGWGSATASTTWPELANPGRALSGPGRRGRTHTGMTAGPIQLDPFDSTDGGEGGETSWGVVVDDRLVGLVVIDPSNPSLTAAGYDHDPAVCELGVLLSAEATAGHPGLELAVWQHVHTMLTELADRPVFVAVSAGAVATVASLRRLAWREIGPAAWLGTDGEPAGELLFFQQPAVRELAA